MDHFLSNVLMKNDSKKAERYFEKNGVWLSYKQNDDFSFFFYPISYWHCARNMIMSHMDGHFQQSKIEKSYMFCRHAGIFATRYRDLSDTMEMYCFDIER